MRSSDSLAAIEDSGWSAIRKNWTILTQIAAGLTTVVATIVAPRPTPVGTLGIRPFASFVVAILAGIFLLALKAIQKTRARTFVDRARSYPLGGDRRRLFLVLQFNRYAIVDQPSFLQLNRRLIARRNRAPDDPRLIAPYPFNLFRCRFQPLRFN
jgi:hypothetical protein